MAIGEMANRAPPGIFRRRSIVATRMIAPGAIEARCAIEDDYHHFRVALSARAGVVSDVRAEAIREPNTLCGAAGGRLAELIGMALDPAPAAVFGVTDQFQQCTHQFDLAGLGVAAMALGRERREFTATVPDRVDQRTVATLDVDGATVLRWTVTGGAIDAPAPYAGIGLGAGFTRFTRALPREEAEAALVLRRALFVSQARHIDMRGQVYEGPVGGCWAWQPERMDRLRRLPDNVRDYSSRPEAPLHDDRDWLAFAD